MAAPGGETPYVEAQYVDTLTREGWLAQAALEEAKPSPPSPLNLMLACVSFLFCPCLGAMAILYAIEAKTVYNGGRYNESQLYYSRARDTAFYAIAIGIGLAVGYGVLFGLRYGIPDEFAIL